MSEKRLTIKDLAKRYEVCQDSVRYWVRTGAFPACADKGFGGAQLWTLAAVRDAEVRAVLAERYRTSGLRKAVSSMAVLEKGSGRWDGCWRVVNLAGHLLSDTWFVTVGGASTWAKEEGLRIVDKL